MTREKFGNLLTYLCLFLLPWQTVWIYGSVIPSPQPSPVGEGEYWKLLVYAVQVLILIAVLVRWKIKASDSIKNVLKKGWWFYGAVLFSCIFSVSPYLSLGFSFHVLSALLLFWLLLDERIETRKIIWFFVLGLIIPCLLGWWQVLSGTSPGSTLFGLAEHLASTPGVAVVETVGGRLMRAYGPFPHPNIFGGFLVVGILAMLGRSTGRAASRPYGQSRRAAIIRSAILFLLSATLVVTFSRSAWLALIVGIISFLVASAISKTKISRNFLFGLTVASVAIVASAAIFHSAIFTRMTAADRLETKSLVERQTEYQMIGEVIKINPFIGVGAGAYTVALAEKFPNHDVWFYQPMHNSILLIFAELGIVGFLFLMQFLWAIFKEIKPRLNAPQCLNALMPLIASLTIIAPLDHYLWDSWAGLGLVAVVLAILMRKSY
jgi:O-antigen ligase